MDTTVFSTPDCARPRPERSLAPWASWWRWLAAAWLLLAAVAPLRAAELLSLRTERLDDGIYLSANVGFELPPVVEDALVKGLSLIFVAEAEIYRERWYWTDKKVASASRSLRLVYQPLTRRWRVSLAGEGSGRVALAQNHDTLAEALASVQRISRWEIAELANVDASNHSLTFRFRLDLSQLPRPFQMGIAGQREWQIGIERSQRLQLEGRATEPAAAEK